MNGGRASARDGRSGGRIWLAAPTRFAGFTRAGALAAGLALALLIGAALTAPASPAPPPAPAEADGGRRSDLLFYDDVADGVRHGGDYYLTAAERQRAIGFPLRPFFTMRLPTLAVAEAFLPRPLTLALLYLLAGGTLLAWWNRLEGVFARTMPRIMAMGLLLAGESVFLDPALAPFHEVWAGLLIALSLARWRPDRFVESAALGLSAALIRETAILYPAVMAGAALLERRAREALGWAAAIAVFALAITLHAQAVFAVTRPDDPASPGWWGMLGLGFFVRVIASLTALAPLPLLLSGVLIAFALAGWAGWRDPLGARVAALIGGYAALIAVCCRADTFYWGLLPAPLLLPGLAFAPDALRDLAAAALGNRRITVTWLAK